METDTFSKSFETNTSNAHPRTPRRPLCGVFGWVCGVFFQTILKKCPFPWAGFSKLHIGIHLRANWTVSLLLPIGPIIARWPAVLQPLLGCINLLRVLFTDLHLALLVLYDLRCNGTACACGRCRTCGTCGTMSQLWTATMSCSTRKQPLVF